MKYFLLLIFLATIIPFSSGQVYTEEVKVLQTGGKVGIGIISPNTELEVNGNVGLGGFDNTAQWGRRLYLNSLNHGSIGINSGSTLFTIFNYSEDRGGFQHPNVISLEDNSGIPKMHINTTNGRVGIGTNNPGNMLHISNTNTHSGMIVQTTDYSSGNTVRIRMAETSLISSITSTSYNGVVDLISTRRGGGASDLTIISSKGSNNMSTKMIIKGATGEVGIGITSPSYKLHVNGTVAATSFHTTSDIKLKNIFGKIKGSDILQKYQQINLYSFSYKQEDSLGIGNKHLKIGIIAQEVDKVFPELVSTTEENIKSVDYSALAITSIEAIKELKREIDIKREEIEELKRLNEQKNNEYLQLITDLSKRIYELERRIEN